MMGCSVRVRAFAVALIAAFVSANGAFATTTDYAWSQTATAFGDYVTVTHDDEGNVSNIAASVPSGDAVRFTGETEAVFASNAVINCTGVGCIEFANPARTKGDLTMRGEGLDEVTLAGGSSLKKGGSVTFPIGDTAVSELKLKAATLAYISGSSEATLTTSFYHERVTADQYEVQIQNFNGAWTRCVKVRITADPTQAGSARLSVVYAYDTGPYGFNCVGADYDTPYPTTRTENGGLYLKDVKIGAGTFGGNRQVKFSGALTRGGKLTVSKHVNCIATGTALGATDGATCALDIVFDDANFLFWDCGTFAQTGTVSGTSGQLVYSSSDASEGEGYSSQSDLSLTTTDQIVAYNASLAMLTGATAVVRWKKYNDTSKEEVMLDAYRGDLPAAFVYPIGDETVVRFQARAKDWTMSYATGVRLMQKGNNIVAKLATCYDVWHIDQPSATDPRTWNHVNDYFVTSATYRFRTVSPQTTVTNLKLLFAGEASDASRTMTATLRHTDSSTLVSYVFKPGANRRLTAVVNSYRGVPQYSGKMLVYDRANVELGYPNVPTDYGPTYVGLWPNSASKSTAAKLVVYEGGRMFSNATRQNSGYGQTITVEGGDVFVLRVVRFLSFQARRIHDRLRGQHRLPKRWRDGRLRALSGPDGRILFPDRRGNVAVRLEERLGAVRRELGKLPQGLHTQRLRRHR